MQDQVDRIALAKALYDLGYLEFRRRWITPVISRKKLARVS
jgi:hypothetical protein